MELQLDRVTKQYGTKLAVDRMNLSMKAGVYGLLGANGAGKTTLMRLLCDILNPTSGEIRYDGQNIHVMGEEYRSLLGYLPQNFGYYPEFTAEKFMLYMAALKGLNRSFAKNRTEELLRLVGLEKEHRKKIKTFSGGMKRRLGIAQAMLNEPEILILDEPTAVLTPQETEKLFAVLRNMRKAGKSIIIITHKLNEVLELSDRVAVLRKGKYIDTVETAKATVESLTEMMVGEKVKLDINRTEPVGAEKRIEMRGITCKNKEGLKVLTEASFTAYSGEILGVAGISGSGQKELLESVAGLQPIESGEILYFSPEGTTEKISEMKAEDIKNLGITLSFVPEDRLGMGLVGSMDLTDNMMIRSYKEGRHFFADRKSPKKLAEDIVEKLDVVTPGVDTPVSRLSGGNVQKILVGREIASNPTVLMVAYPVRGLDINSSYTIYNLLNDQKKKGVAVICVGEDLDVLLELCDKILVLNSGKVAGIVDARTTTKEKLGLMMTGLTEDKNE